MATILTQIAGTLRTVTGNDFHGYKRNTFLRRVHRRMQVLQARNIEDYAAILRKNREEVHNLFQDLLIGVTQFFRDPKEFEALERELPGLFEGKDPSDQFRVWVLGCATGEEAYSLGILLAEQLQRLDNAPSVQIFATDLDARALGAARAGRYSSAIAHRVRNTLAVVKSITQRTAESSSSVDEMAAHLNGRLDAFARVQSAVTRNPDAGIDLRSLIDDELLAHAAHEGEGLSVHGPDVALRAKAAESVSLALHELTTNAVKHGALAQRNGGQIGISWRLNGSRNARELSFEWVEKHANGPNGNPERHGFGMELLTRILPYDLGANTSVEFNDNGLIFQMDLPSDHLAEPIGKHRK